MWKPSQLFLLILAVSGVAVLIGRVRLSLSFVCSDTILFSLLRRFFLRGSSYNTRRMITVATSELGVLASFQFLLYAAKVAAPDYFVGLLRFDYVGSHQSF